MGRRVYLARVPTYNIEVPVTILEDGYTGPGREGGPSGFFPVPVHFQIQAIDLEDAKKKIGRAFSRMMRDRDEGYPFK
jgi:hypothetical protein